MASAGHMQICISPQTDNHTSITPLSFLQAGCPSCCPTNSVTQNTEGTSTEGTTELETINNRPAELMHWRTLKAQIKACDASFYFPHP